MKLKYIRNEAVMIYFPILIPDQDLKLDIILSKPKGADITDPELIIAHYLNIVHPDDNKSISLSGAVYNQKTPS